ncbi:hypothetical protein [Arthrobacter rhizosphaerae]|uniref:hypothetical protein n=1 Tax=Arthrobacter rhizosphaerae TaxID=2855490 RepID=UPI001FF4188F|nr:hypothetical protein [Arthrobacter rhizosphaerae]
MADEAGKKSDLTSASNRIRETAKWLTVSLALLGGVLTAGIQFSGIGSLTPGSERFDIAIRGAALAAIGTALILFGTVWTASTPPARLAKLKNEDYIDRILRQHDATLEEIRDDYEQTLLARSRNARAYWPDESSDSSQDPPDPDKAKQANSKLAFLEPIIENIMTVASYQKLTRRWAISAIVIAFGAVIAGGGIGVFIWATNPPANLASSTASPAVVGKVGSSSLTLSDGGRLMLNGDLGQGCPTNVPLQVLLLSESGSGSDVVITEPGCEHIRVLMTADWGTIR